MKLWEKQVVAKTGKIVRYFFKSSAEGHVELLDTSVRGYYLGRLGPNRKLI